jgi:hypothetical protein
MRWDIVDKAFELGAEDFGMSKRKDKRFYVVYNDKKINFGDPNAYTYFDGASSQKRKSYRARHSKIKLKDGSLAYKNKNQASFWAYNLLW